MDEILDYGSFAAWLARFPEREIVGTRDSGENCPLANYLRSERGANYPWVGQKLYTPALGAYSLRPLPTWARLFASSVDASGPDFTGITARRALGIAERAAARAALPATREG